MVIDIFLKHLTKKPTCNSFFKARVAIIDWIGYSIAGTKTEQAKPFFNIQKTLPKGSTLNLFSKNKLNFFDSAFINASVGNILELDDVHRTSIIHPGDTVIPAAIAAASYKKVSPYKFLQAVVSGYEASIRMGVCLGKEHYKYFYSSATCGVYGATTAASMILNHDTSVSNINEKLNTSIQLSTMTSSGVWQCREGLGEAKQYALANAAKSGVTAAFLAQNGAKAPNNMIEGQMGFLKAYTNEINYQNLIKNNKTSYINEVSNKPWPACRHSHPVIGTSLELVKYMKENNQIIDNVSSIEIQTYQVAIDFCDKMNPTNRTEGKFSLQHCCAISLMFNEIKEDYFNQEFINNPNVQKIRNKVKIKENLKMSSSFPNEYSVSIKLNFTNGFHFEITNKHAKGDPENPMSENEICDKTFALLENASVNMNDAKNLINTILKTDISQDAYKADICWFNDLQNIIAN